MRAILRSYGCDGRQDDLIGVISGNHCFSGHDIDSIPSSAGSNQLVVSLDDAGLYEGDEFRALRLRHDKLLRAVATIHADLTAHNIANAMDCAEMMLREYP